MLITTVGLALSALLRNKLRSSLTTLGVVIGVGAVVLMQAMGGGATAYIGRAISGLGSNMLIAIPGAMRGMQHAELGASPFDQRDLEAIQRHAHEVALISAAGDTIKRVVAGPYHRSTTVAGAQPTYFAIRTWGVVSGRMLSAQDERRAAAVCLIGQTVASGLFPGRDAVGNELRIQQTSCRIVGVLSPKGATFGQDQDDVVFLPHSTFSRRIVGSDKITALLMSATSPDRVEDAKRQVAHILRRRRHISAGEEDDFAVRDPREMQNLLESVMSMLTTLLAGVAAVSLVVGGIGIMNIMLVSVAERTREIGVRLAIGARRGDVLLQFLLEAVCLSLLGGLVGTGVGLAAARGVSSVLAIPFVVPTTAIGLALSVSIVVGIAFGVIPARKAARLQPWTALRFE